MLCQAGECKVEKRDFPPFFCRRGIVQQKKIRLPVVVQVEPYQVFSPGGALIAALTYFNFSRTMADRVESDTVGSDNMDQDSVDMKTVDNDNVDKHAEERNVESKDADDKDTAEKDATDKDTKDESDEDEDDGNTNNDSSSETWTGPSAEVLEAFNKLLRNYSYSLNQVFCRTEKNLTLDDLDLEMDTFNDVQTCLLPSLKQQIRDLVESLDLSEFANHPCPNPESTAKILSQLGDTLKSTRSAVEELALESPLPDKSYDGHLKQLKVYRTSRLLWKTKAAIQERICGLFEACFALILESERADKVVVDSLVPDSPISEDHDSDFLGYQPKASQCRIQIIKRLKNSCNSIDATIEYSKLSDFAILQREWRGSTRKLGRQLEALAHILNGTYTRQKGDKIDDRSDSEKEKDLAHKARAIQLAKSAVPIVKLSRIFYDKLSKTSINQLPFELDTEMSSEELGSLLKTLESFYESVDYMSGHLCVIFESADGIDRKIQSLRKICVQNIDYFEKALLALSLYLIPTSHSSGGRSAPQTHFKTWFLGLRNQLNSACIDLQNATDTCFGDILDDE
ncbi:hypothetical protein MJO28_012507 [Puccinia striiformis f. sp. tritici]|uniref:Uncharacterized protein n=1 Tax=Puccinia striiformis f. sp. tritici TaxID=168172 RepID=A0ACC0E0H6_9BASI|nr:hypothetical protein MJO28_012507 [Puccinia striiformis f. sp. tritici]